jgi:hypothetical protein
MKSVLSKQLAKLLAQAECFIWVKQMLPSSRMAKCRAEKYNSNGTSSRKDKSFGLLALSSKLAGTCHLKIAIKFIY